jgi:tetratricopeptide (TPR) repeat protein
MKAADEHGRSMKADGDGAGGFARVGRARDAALAAAVVAGLACVFALSQWLDARRPAQDAFASYEESYVSPETARRMSLGFNGLAADWYWLRSLQYVGGKALAHKGGVALDDMSALGIESLAPMLEHATTLDPQFLAAYEFGAVILPSVDRDAAVRLLEKGVRENPGEWRLYHELGYIHWQAGRYREAAEAYAAGSRAAGAPAWMRVLAARMEAEGGGRQVAREVYLRLYEEASDRQVKRLAATRVAELDSLEERDAIRRALADFRSRNYRCAASWREIVPALRNARLRLDASGAPLDPTDVPYALDPEACDVRLGERSEIPKK